jgi:hypothetical protein
VHGDPGLVHQVRAQPDVTAERPFLDLDRRPSSYDGPTDDP